MDFELAEKSFQEYLKNYDINDKTEIIGRGGVAAGGVWLTTEITKQEITKKKKN